MLTSSTNLSIFDADLRRIDSVAFIWICNRSDANIEETLEIYLLAAEQEPIATSLVVLNNGLGEETTHRITERLRREPIQSTCVSFNAPSPESTALVVAMKETDADVVVLLPAYPQADPQDIWRMVDAVRDGSDYVASCRSPRIDSLYDQRKSQLFNLATRWFSGINIHDINSGLRVMRREVVENLPLYGDMHLYLPILAARHGFQVDEVPVRHLEERPSVTAGDGISVYPRRALDLLSLFFLMRFTQKPFRFFGGIGGALFAGGGLINVFLALQKLVYHDELADRPLLVLGALMMVLGIQMISLGLIGELIIFVNAGGVTDYQIERVYETNANSSHEQL